MKHNAGLKWINKNLSHEFQEVFSGQYNLSWQGIESSFHYTTKIFVKQSSQSH